MGKLHKFTYYLLGLFCASAFAVQALAVESTARVHTSIDAASGYRGITSSTARTPPGVNIRPLPSVALPDVTKMASGGLQQVMPGTVSIDGVKGSHPINMRVRATASTLKGGTKSLLKGGLAGIAITYGIEQLFDAVDWIMDDGGQPVKLADYFVAPQATGDVSYGASCQNIYNFCADRIGGGILAAQGFGDPGHMVCANRTGEFLNFVGISGTPGSANCVYSYTAPAWENDSYSPVTGQAIDAAVDQYYVPETEDWPLLSPRIQPDDVEIYDLPATIYGEPETVTIYDPAGNPQSVTVTQPAYNLEPRENPSPQPALDLNIDVETRTYNEHGELTGISTATSTAPAGAGGGEPPDIPTDCGFMPTVCAFLEWFQEPDPEVNNEPDLSVLRDELGAEDIDRDFQVGASTAGCPPPLQISFFMFPNTELSLQPLCDFVDLLRPLVLMLAFFTASTIVLRS